MCVCVYVCVRTLSCSVVSNSLQLHGLMDCRLPGSSVHEIFQAKILEQVAISYSRGSSRPKDNPSLLHCKADSLLLSQPGKLICITVFLLPIQSPLIYFSSLITMTRTSKTIPNKIGMDILVLFLILEEIFSFFIIENDILCGFVIYCLYYVEVYSLYAHFLERFFFLITNGW